MVAEYFQWQFVAGPAWLMQFLWNMQRALFRLFSVWVMIRTLLAPWRRDVIEYRDSPFGSVIMTFGWNQISRGIGFIIRLSLLSVWMLCECAFIVLATVTLCAFLAWPLLSMIGVVVGTILLFG